MGKKIFLILFPVFGFAYLIFSHHSFAGGDDVYQYLRFSSVWLEHGWSMVKSMPWLPYSFPGNTFSDLWLLFHFYLLPFSWLPQPFGGKIATFILELGILGSFYLVLREYVSNKYLRLFALIITPFALSSDFLFRLLLTRAHLFNIIFVLLLILFIKKKNTIGLVIVSGLFAFNNVAAILVIPILFTHVFADLILRKQISLKIILAIISGYMIGLLIHPNLVSNFVLTVQQIYGDLFLARNIGTPVGSEMYPYSLRDFFSVNLFASVLFFLSCAYAFKGLIKKNISSDQLWLFSMAVVFFVMTVHSKRFVEYWVPITSLVFMVFFSEKISKLNWRNFWELIMGSWQFKSFAIFMLGIFMYAGVSTIVKVNSYLDVGYSYDSFQGAGEWLRTATNQNEIVFNVDWDAFPQLLFWDDKNRYVVGMDPMFLFWNNPVRFTDWLNIAEDHRKFLSQKSLAKILKNDFQARFIVLDIDNHPNLYNHLMSEPEFFMEMFNDGRVAIFEAL